MFSGIGDSEELKSYGIEIKHHSPGVGKNLHDHMLLGVGFKSKIDLDPPGLLSEAGIFTYAVEKESLVNSPDLQLLVVLCSLLIQNIKLMDLDLLCTHHCCPISRGEVLKATIRWIIWWILAFPISKTLMSLLWN